METADPLSVREKGTIAVLPVGRIPEAALRAVANYIPSYFKHAARILPPLEIPPSAFDERRRQYDAAAIIKALEAMDFKSFAKVIGILNVDLFIPIFTHVMGEAQEGGRFALVSMYRLLKEAEGKRSPPSKILERLVKVALHELGHLFDRVHCIDEKCLMHFSGNIEEIDRIRFHLCVYCEKQLSESLKWNPCPGP